MVKIIKFRVALDECEKYIWREITIKENETLSILMSAILYSFEATGNHCYILEYKDKQFEYYIKSKFSSNSCTEPDKIKLSDLNLCENDTMKIIYDFRLGWEFNITVKSISDDLDENTKSIAITKGQGKGLVEGLTPSDIIKMIEYTKEKRKPANKAKYEYWLYDDDDFFRNQNDYVYEDSEAEGKEDEIYYHPWDYREFDIKKLNKNLEEGIKSVYEYRRSIYS